MNESSTPPIPVLQKPPGYKDPTLPVHSVPGGTGLPPRNPMAPPAFRPRKKRKSCCRICCCCFCAFFFFLLIIIVLLGGIFYLWYEPQPPLFQLQSFTVAQFNVSVKSDGMYLTARTIAKVEAKNPNGKLTLHYGRTKVEVTFGDGIDLGSTSLGGFSQGKKNVTSMRFETAVSNEKVDGGSGKNLKSRYQSKELEVNVMAETSVGVGVEGLKIGMMDVGVVCGGVTLKQLDNGRMPKCNIKLLNLIDI